MGKVPDKGLDAYLSSAKDMANGTLPMLIVVEDHQVGTAKEWLKGKRKVKNLSIISRTDHAAQIEERQVVLEKQRKAIRKKLK